MDDLALIGAVGSRRDGALAEIYRRYQPTMHRSAVRWIGPAGAEDAVQEVFERLWANPSAFDHRRGTLGAFLTVLTRSRAIDMWRSAESRKSREATQPVTEVFAQDVESAVLSRNGVEGLLTRLRALPAKESEAIMLAYLGGHTYREVALLLDRPEGTTKSAIRAGLRRMRADLEAVAS